MKNPEATRLTLIKKLATMATQMAPKKSYVFRTLAIIGIIGIGVCTFAFAVYAAALSITLAITCPLTTTPVQLGGSFSRGKTIVFLGTKGNRVNNAGVVWIQNVSANDSNGIPLQPGQIISFSSGQTLSASDFWIDATVANDGVVAWVQDRP